MIADIGSSKRDRRDDLDLRDYADEIVWAATRAPSYRNAQPWRFRVAARQVEVYADRSRSCPVADPDDRELFLGLGAAVFDIRLAFSRLCLRPVVGLSRDHARPDLAAVVVAAGHVHVPDEDVRLYDQLDRRRTVWTPFASEPVPVDLEVELADLIRHEGATPRWLLTAGTRQMLTGLARRAAADRLEDPAVRREAGRWPTAIPPPKAAPTLLVICTPADHRADWLRAGQALQHVLLAASAAGIAGSFLSPVIDSPRLRRQFRSEVDLPGCPQVLLGLGRPEEAPAPAPARRPLAAVLMC